ncbi:MAG: DNA primase [Proteobacteria bacterium]|nr:DNA primase [Pseudomonadota bacterium]
MNYISNEKIEEVLSNVDIVEVIEEYVPLKQVGANYRALCPFHTEKTPSFYVSREKGIYHCFGCGRSGNAIKFLMEYNNITFPEAIAVLAEKAGIKLGDGYETSGSENNYRKILEDALHYFEDSLSGSKGNIAVQYIKNREISEKMVGKFHIGYAPPHGLLNYIGKKGWKTKDVIKTGLVIKTESGEIYERFRNRIMFPIYNTVGKIIAFGGRSLGNELPKYINSPETEYYKKGHIFFGIWQAKNKIKEVDEAVIVEGYIDLISLHQKGIENVIAPLGTALTSEQARLLKRYTGSVILMFDADEAGLKASERGINICLKQGLSVYIALMEKGMDPDDYIKKYGVEALKERIDEKVNFLDFKITMLKKKYNFNDVDQVSRALREIKEIVLLIPDVITRELWYKRIAEQFEIPIETVRTEKVKSIENTRKEKVVKRNELNSIYANILNIINIAHDKQNFFDYIKTYIPFQYLQENAIGKIIYDIVLSENMPSITDMINSLDGKNRDIVYEGVFMENTSDKLLMQSLKMNWKKLLRIKLKEINNRISNALLYNEDVSEYEERQSEIIHHLQKIKAGGVDG